MATGKPPPGTGSPPALVPACIWRISPALIAALDERFGPPLDAYVNGSQVWIRDDGPRGEALEWRLHPVAGYARPRGVTTEELFDVMTAASHAGEGPASLADVWEGLECFAAYGDEMEPATLAEAATVSVGVPPDAAGMVDHETVADAWERSGRRSSIIGSLLTQLGAVPD